MSILDILYIVLIVFLVWILIFSVIFGVVLIRAIQQMQRSIRQLSQSVENGIQSLRPSNYLNAETAQGILKWGLQRIFK